MEVCTLERKNLQVMAYSVKYDFFIQVASGWAWQ